MCFFASPRLSRFLSKKKKMNKRTKKYKYIKRINVANATPSGLIHCWKKCIENDGDHVEKRILEHHNNVYSEKGRSNKTSGTCFISY